MALPVKNPLWYWNDGNWGPACGTERSAASANNMIVFPGVLGYRTLRRTVQVRLGFDLGFRISDLGFLTIIDDIELYSSDFAIRSLVLRSFLAYFQSEFCIPHSAIVCPVARPPRLSEHARDPPATARHERAGGGQAHLSPRSRDIDT